MEDLTVHGTIRVKLTSAKTYSEYFQSIPGLSDIIDTYENLGNNDEYYTTLASRCVDVLFPLDVTANTEFVSILQNMETIYASVRDLFIQLCSYNITFLETERTMNWYLPYHDPDVMYPGDVTYTLDHIWYLVYPPLDFKHKMQTILANTEIPFEFHVDDSSNLEFTWSGDISMEYPLAPKLNWSNKISISPGVTETDVKVKNILNLKIYTDGTSVTKR